MPPGMAMSFLSPVAAMASVQQSPICAFGCAMPMQPLPDAPEVWRCSGCGCIAMPRNKADTTTAVDVPDVISNAIGILQSAAELLGDYNQDVALPMATPHISFQHAIQLEASVRRVIGLLRSEPLSKHADAVHAIAIEAAARICLARAQSLFNDSHDPHASLEAQKCATALRRIATRADLAARPELTAPRASDEGGAPQ